MAAHEKVERVVAAHNTAELFVAVHDTVELVVAAYYEEECVVSGLSYRILEIAFPLPSIDFAGPIIRFLHIFAHYRP